MKQLLLMVMLVWPAYAFSQDVIVKKDGSTIISKVQEINEDNIKYKKFSNLNGPLYTIKKAEVMSVNYENGEKDVFEKSKSTLSSGFIEKQGDSRNTKLLELYNRNYSPSDRVKKKGSSANNYLIIFGITSSSILSNEDIEMTFVRRDIFDQYKIKLTNKTDKTLYIDKENCFRILNNGQSSSFYSPEIVTTVSIDTKKEKGLGEKLGIGGFVGNVLDESSKNDNTPKSVIQTTVQQRIIAIPPRGSQYLMKQMIDKNELLNIYESFEFIRYNVVEDKRMNDYMSASIIGTTPGLVDKGETLTYSESESPWAFGYIVRYSNDEKFTTYSTLKADLYVHQLIGCQNIVWNSESRYKYIDGFNNYTLLGYY